MKERYEWIQSWCDEAPNSDLPRVLLVGDSITLGYQESVRRKLKGVCYVDFISTSYAIDTKIYNTLISAVAGDGDYALIHFNHGLHGQHMPKRTYKSRLKKLLLKIKKDSKVVLATSTIVYCEGNTRLEKSWAKKVKERNDAVREIALAFGFYVDDLYPLSVSVSKDKRVLDGVHYTEKGYEEFACAVSDCIRKII